MPLYDLEGFDPSLTPHPKQQQPPNPPPPPQAPQKKQYNTGFFGFVNRVGNAITRKVQPVERSVVRNVSETARNIWNQDVQSVKDYTSSLLSPATKQRLAQGQGLSAFVARKGEAPPQLLNPRVPTGKAVASTFGKLGNVAGATIGTATAVYYPVATFGLSAAEAIPGPVGSTAKLVNKGFELLGAGGGAIFRATIDTLPMSDESKRELYPAADQLGAAIGQFAGMALLHKTGVKVNDKLGISERIGDIKAKLISKTQKLLVKKQERGVVNDEGKPEITPGDARVIANEVMKETPVHAPGTVTFTTMKGEVPVKTNQMLVLQNFLKGREDVTYKKVKSLGNDPNGNPVQAKFEWDYKKKEATIYVTKGTTAENLAHEIGHYYDQKLSLGIANQFSEIIPDYLRNKQEVQDTLTEYAVHGEPGAVGFADVTPKQVNVRVGKLVRNFTADIEKLAKGEGEKRTAPSEQFATAVRAVLTKPEESMSVAPEFTKFVQFVSEGQGLVADAVKTASKGITLTNQEKPVETPTAGGKVVQIAQNTESGKTGKFWTTPEGSDIGFGSVKKMAYVDTGKLFKGTSSYDFIKQRGLMDEAFQKKLDEASTGKDPNMFYKLTQDKAEAILKDEGYKGAHWTHEDDLNPTQYQIWDKSILSTKEAPQAPVSTKPAEVVKEATPAEKPPVNEEKAPKTTPTEATFAQTGLKTGKTVEGRPAFNPDKINSSADVQRLVQGISSSQGEFSKQRLSKTDANVRALANEVGITAEQLAQLKPGSIANAETVFKARQIVSDLAKDLRETIKSIKPESATKEQLQVVKEKYLRLTGAMRAVAGFRTESSNIFRQLKMESMPGEYDIMQDLVGSLKALDAKAGEDLASFTKGLKGQVSAQALQELVIKKNNGKPLTPEEAADISKKAKTVNDLEPTTKGFEDMVGNKESVIKYLQAVSELQKTVQELSPSHNLRVITEIIGRGTMLFSIKSPLLNIESNAIQGLLQAAEKRISSGKGRGVVDRSDTMDYVKFATETFNKTGFDLTRMVDSTDIQKGVKKVLGETRVHSEGGGPIRKVGRFYERNIFRKTLGVPDVISSALQAADTANLSATTLARSEGLTGAKLKARATEIFHDILSVNPKTEEGKVMRQQAVADAEYATWQNESRASTTSLAIRKAVNAATGDMRLGDLNIPFAKTPANVISAGVESAGGGLFTGLFNLKKAMFDKTIDEAGKKAAVKKAVRGFTRAGIGMTAGLVIASLLDKNDFIGTYPTDQKERNLMTMRGGTENMIRIGNKWVSLEYFGPVGVPIAGMMYAKKYGKNFPEKLLSYIQGSSEQLLRLPGIKEAYDLVKGFQENLALGMTPQKILANAKGNIIDFVRARTIPGFVNDIAQATDTSQRDTAGEPTSQFQASIPGVRKGLPVKVNILGEEQKTTGAGQIFFGSRLKNVSDDPVKSFLVENRLTISVPSKTTEVKPIHEHLPIENGSRVGRPMTDQEYYNYVKYSGQQIRQRLNNTLSVLQHIAPDKRQDYLDNIVDKSRKSTKRLIEIGKYR